MPTRKIADPCDSDMSWLPPKCRHPDHEPAKMVVRPPGTYEHECPACHKKTVFTVRSVRMGAPIHRAFQLARGALPMNEEERAMIEHAKRCLIAGGFTS